MLFEDLGLPEVMMSRNSLGEKRRVEHSEQRGSNMEV